MKICMFAKGLPVHTAGGMEIHTWDLVNGLIKRGHEVTIITTKHPNGVKKEDGENLTIYYIGDRPLYIKGKFQKQALKLFVELDKREHFDIVHSQSSAGISYAELDNRAPLIVTRHGFHLGEVKSKLHEKNIKSFLIAIFMYLSSIRRKKRNKRLLNERVNKSIAVSYQIYEDIRKHENTPEDRMVAIPNGIDVSRFKPMPVEELRESLNSMDEKIIVSIGAIHKQKGFHLLLKVLPDILKYDNKVRLVIVGTGPYLDRLKMIADKLNISESVVFAGRVSDDDLPGYYNLADVIVNPTMRLEGLPLVIPEAMACEKPVIASAIGGIKDVIENGVSGTLVPPGDVDALKENIIRILSDEQLAHELGKNARKRVVDRFSLDRMVEDTLNVYESVLGGNK